jgi:hypothetical protein
VRNPTTLAHDARVVCLAVFIAYRQTEDIDEAQSVTPVRPSWVAPQPWRMVRRTYEAYLRFPENAAFRMLVRMLVAIWVGLRLSSE